MTIANRSNIATNKIEVAKPFEFLVIRDACRTIAESDLGPNIQVKFRTAVCRLALERLTLPPLIHREGPLRLDPYPMLWNCGWATYALQNGPIINTHGSQSAQYESSSANYASMSHRTYR